MAITAEELEQALSAHLSCGPFADPDFPDSERKETRWNAWLARLNGDDIPILLGEAIRHLDRVGSFAVTDPWLLALLTCLREAGWRSPDIYLKYADQYRHTPYRAIFLSTAGSLFSDDAVDWLRDVQERESLNEVELRLIASSYWESRSPLGLVGLDRMLAMTPTESSELRAFISQLRSELADSMIDEH
jgi:hypothetical protein